jgi:5-methylcytosine-specific restriction endonuclease McrA
MAKGDAAPSIQTRKYRLFREDLKTAWRAKNKACAICGQRTIDYDGPKGAPDSFELDHKISRKRARLMGRPELVMDPNNAQPSHLRCNRNKQAGDAQPSLGTLDEDY